MIGLMIRSNQQRIVLERRSIAALRSGRGRVYSGRVDVTEECIADAGSRVSACLEANRILRKHPHS
jgi:hypothetical protein